MKPTLAPWLGAAGAGLSLIALGNLPYGYYTFLRVAITGIAILLSVMAYRALDFGWLWALIPIAILWNPAIPIHLERTTWAGLNVAAAALLGFAGYYLSRRPDSTSKGQ